MQMQFGENKNYIGKVRQQQKSSLISENFCVFCNQLPKQAVLSSFFSSYNFQLSAA